MLKINVFNITNILNKTLYKNIALKNTQEIIINEVNSNKTKNKSNKNNEIKNFTSNKQAINARNNYAKNNIKKLDKTYTEVDRVKKKEKCKSRARHRYVF